MFVLVSCKQTLLLKHIIAFITFPFMINVTLYMSCQVLRPLECLFAGAMETLVHPRLIMNVCVLMQSTVKCKDFLTQCTFKFGCCMYVLVCSMRTGSGKFMSTGSTLNLSFVG